MIDDRLSLVDDADGIVAISDDCFIPDQGLITIHHAAHRQGHHTVRP